MKEKDKEGFRKLIKKRIGEDATDLQIAQFLRSLSSEEMFNLIMDMALDEMAKETTKAHPPDDGDYRDKCLFALNIYPKVLYQ
mgnify:CR=1 FL=1